MPARPLLSLTAYIANAGVAHLTAGGDDDAALRSALLLCILMLEEAQDPAVKNFCTMLLTKFEPLSRAFVENKINVLPALRAMRAHRADGSVTLFLPESDVRKLVGDE